MRHDFSHYEPRMQPEGFDEEIAYYQGCDCVLHRLTLVQSRKLVLSASNVSAALPSVSLYRTEVFELVLPIVEHLLVGKHRC